MKKKKKIAISQITLFTMNSLFSKVHALTFYGGEVEVVNKNIPTEVPKGNSDITMIIVGIVLILYGIWAVIDKKLPVVAKILIALPIVAFGLIIMFFR